MGATEEATTHAASTCLALWSRVVGAVCAIAAAGVLARYGGAGAYSTSFAAEEDVAAFSIAAMMSFPVLLLEGARAVATCTSAIDYAGQKRLCKMMVLQFLVKSVGYLVMWKSSGGIVHLNRRSPDLRPVYTVRWLDWSITVPALILTSNAAFQSEDRPMPAGRLVPALAVNFGMVVAAWAGQVVENQVAGWAMTALSMLAWMLAISEQVLIVVERRRLVPFARFKVSAVAAKEVYFAAYGVVMLMDNLGIIGSFQAQMFYTYADVFLKALQASVMAIIRSWDAIDFVHTTMSCKVDRAEADMSRMISDASVPIVCLDTEGVIAGWNQKMAKLTRIDEADAIGMPLADLTLQECREPLESKLEACSQSGSTGTMELVLRDLSDPKAAGAHLTINFVVKLGIEGSGGIIGIGQDITELMASKVLQEKRMRASAVVSHELKSPLHGIVGLARSMHSDAKDEMDKKQLSMILGCSSRMLDFVSNIMDQASIEVAPQEKTMIQKLSVNMLDILDEVVCMTRAAVSKSGKPLVCDEVQLIHDTKTDTVPLVKGDPYKCTQLFYNLVTNACKFTKRGFVKVSLRRGDGEIQIDVSDTGCGIEQAALGRIFQAYQQEPGADARNFQGIGLGLSVAQGIAHQHGGEIRVASEIGAGSTFTVILPCSQEEAPRKWAQDAVQTKAPSKMSRPPPPRPKRKTAAPQDEKPLILSVDDDTVNHIVIKGVLGSKYRIVEAMDGLEALEYLKSDKEQPTLVLLDIMMPRMTGMELLKAIRHDLGPETAALPVLMLSAGTANEKDDVISCKSHGASDFMSKPFDRTRLLETVGALIDAHKQSQAPEHEEEDEDPEIIGEAEQQEQAGVSHDQLESLRQQLRAEVSVELKESKEEAANLKQEVQRVKEQAEVRMDALKSDLCNEGAELARVKKEADGLRAEVARLEAEKGAIEQPAEGRRHRDREATEASATSISELTMDMRRGLDSNELSADHGVRQVKWLRMKLARAEESLTEVVEQLALSEQDARRLRFSEGCNEREISYLKAELSHLRRSAPEDLLASS